MREVLRTSSHGVTVVSAPILFGEPTAEATVASEPGVDRGTVGREATE